VSIDLFTVCGRIFAKFFSSCPFFINTITHELLLGEILQVHVPRQPLGKPMGQSSRLQDRIFGFFTIARYGKKFVSTITQKLLHLA